MNMLANKNVFCNTPWYELHIYWDGSFGICCQEAHKLYPDGSSQYNIKNMTIMEWFNSNPVKKFRSNMLKNSMLTECKRCMLEEKNQGHSRRIKSNSKSVIFTRTAFEPSFLQSPGYKHFKLSHDTQGYTDTYPIDLHIDLGNFCNLACKTCYPSASSAIASQHVQWGIESDRKFLGVDWTNDSKVWENFKQQLLEIPNLNNIHLMGGETILTNRFEDLVDTLIENKKFNVCLSFVTNGMLFKPRLVEKLTKFKRVGIEVSIETLDLRNDYIRQGNNTRLVLENISKYLSYCNNDSITVTLRPTPSLLSIGYYIGVLEYALEKKLIIKSSFIVKPDFMQIKNLPTTVKNLYKKKYLDFLTQFETSNKTDYNASDPHQYKTVIKEQAEMCLAMLSDIQPDNVDDNLTMLVNHCRRWDKVYNLNAWDLYPELNEIWDKYGY